MAAISTHTWPRSMPCNRYQKMTATSSSDSTACAMRDRGVAGTGFWSAITSTLT
jgi:hypothetical protein